MYKLSKTVEIAPEICMPTIGIGTWEMHDEKVLHGVLDAAFAVGYRMIDTAYAYANEQYIGKSLNILLPKHGLKRSDIFIITKLPTSHFGTINTERAILESLANLKMDYIDLYLIHSPGSADEFKARAESWKVLEQHQRRGVLKSIGVSNYMIPHLMEMKQYAEISPVVNQCEFHPRAFCGDLLNFCRRGGIHFQAYSSLGSAHDNKALFREPLVLEMCKKYNCDPAQFLLAWALNQGVSVLPKSFNREHVITNFKALEISLAPQDVAKFFGLGVRDRYRS